MYAQSLLPLPLPAVIPTGARSLRRENGEGGHMFEKERVCDTEEGVQPPL